MQARHSLRAAVKLSVYMPVALKLDSSDLCAALLVVGVAFRNATFSGSKVVDCELGFGVGGVVEVIEDQNYFLRTVFSS